MTSLIDSPPRFLVHIRRALDDVRFEWTEWVDEHEMDALVERERAKPGRLLGCSVIDQEREA